MMQLKAVALGLAFAGMVGVSPAVQAAPLGAASATTLAGETTTNIAFGCGPGFTRGYYGRCRPIPGFYRRRFGPPGFYGRPRFYGPRPYYRY